MLCGPLRIHRTRFDWMRDPRLMDAVRSRFGHLKLELRAMNGLFPPSLDEAMIKQMAEAGFKTLNLSLGSFCQDQLKRFRRPDVREAFNRCLIWAGKYGLNAVGYIICGAPFQSAAASVSDLLRLAEKRVLTGVSLFYPALWS